METSTELSLVIAFIHGVLFESTSRFREQTNKNNFLSSSWIIIQNSKLFYIMRGRENKIYWQ